jgi:hypothetical protein
MLPTDRLVLRLSCDAISVDLDFGVQLYSPGMTSDPTPVSPFSLLPDATTALVSSPDIPRAHAVVDALFRFGLAQDRRDDTGALELFRSAFTEDAVLDFRPAARKCGIEVPLMEGRDVISAIIMNPSTRIDTTHVITNPRVAITGASAELTAIVEAQHLPKHDHSRNALLKNLYSVTAREVDGLWRMSRVYIDCVWYIGDPRVIGGN